MRAGLFSFSEEKLIGVPNVLLKFCEGFALAHDTWDFNQLADVPVSIFPIFEGKVYIFHLSHPLRLRASILLYDALQ
jgi:hypothetical protein